MSSLDLCSRFQNELENMDHRWEANDLPLNKEITIHLGFLEIRFLSLPDYLITHPEQPFPPTSLRPNHLYVYFKRSDRSHSSFSVRNGRTLVSNCSVFPLSFRFSFVDVFLKFLILHNMIWFSFYEINDLVFSRTSIAIPWRQNCQPFSLFDSDDIHYQTSTFNLFWLYEYSKLKSWLGNRMKNLSDKCL